jgi:hypothetical protein
VTKINLTSRKYKLLKHFFKNIYGIDFDTFYSVKRLEDIASKDDAEKYIKFMQIIYFADAKTSAKGHMPVYKIHQFKDYLFTRRIELEEELNKISNSEKVSSVSANRAVGIFYLLKVLTHTFELYADMIKNDNYKLMEDYFLPPKTEYVKKISEDPVYHRIETLRWLKSFNPIEYSDDADADIECLPETIVNINLSNNQSENEEFGPETE